MEEVFCSGRGETVEEGGNARAKRAQNSWSEQKGSIVGDEKGGSELRMFGWAKGFPRNDCMLRVLSATCRHVQGLYRVSPRRLVIEHPAFTDTF